MSSVAIVKMASASGRSPNFVHKKCAQVQPSLLAECLANRDPSWPHLVPGVPDFSYSHVKFESRPSTHEILKFENMMLELNLLCEDRRFKQKATCHNVTSIRSEVYGETAWTQMVPLEASAAV